MRLCLPLCKPQVLHGPLLRRSSERGNGKVVGFGERGSIPKRRRISARAWFSWIRFLACSTDSKIFSSIIVLSLRGTPSSGGSRTLSAVGNHSTVVGFKGGGEYPFPG